MEGRMELHLVTSRVAGRINCLKETLQNIKGEPVNSVNNPVKIVCKKIRKKSSHNREVQNEIHGIKYESNEIKGNNLMERILKELEDQFKEDTNGK